MTTWRAGQCEGCSHTASAAEVQTSPSLKRNADGRPASPAPNPGSQPLPGSGTRYAFPARSLAVPVHRRASRFMRIAAIPLVLMASACTYGPAEERSAVQNVAIKPDASRVALIVKYERFRNATGLAAFPDGGTPKMLDQRADVYVVSLPDRQVLSKYRLTAPESHRVAFNPWLMGWDGETLVAKVTGCPATLSNECYGPLVRMTVFSASPGGELTPDTRSRKPILLSRINSELTYLYVGIESYGASIGTAYDQPIVPLMRFSGHVLEPVPP